MLDIDQEPRFNLLPFAVYNNLSSYVDLKVPMDISSLKPTKEILFLVIAFDRS
jgi:hypothetical protein